MTSGESVTVATDRKRPHRLAAMLRSQMRNIAPFLTLICLFGFFSVASPSRASRMSRSSRSLSRVIDGTRSERFGCISKAPSATSRRIASRTGVRLTPSVPAT